MDDYCKRSGQIPAFGDWDYANEMPITQYFESARQAGLVRYSSSSGESEHPYHIRGAGDLYAVDNHFIKPNSRNYVAPPVKTRVREKRWSNVKEIQKRQVKKVCDVTEPARKQPQQNNINNRKLHPHNDAVKPTATRSRILPASASAGARPPKAVDEDLYKIPPELLRSSKRKKMPGLFSCLVPSCAS